MSEVQVTLPISGVTVTLRRPRISTALLSLQLQKKYPKPKPPVLEVAVLGQKERFVNHADPDYKASVAEWNSEQGIRLVNFLTDLAVVPPDPASLNGEVHELRELLPELTEGLSDRDVWLNYYAVQGDADYEALTNAVGALVGPTEEQIEQSVETFRPHA